MCLDGLRFCGAYSICSRMCSLGPCILIACTYSLNAGRYNQNQFLLILASVCVFINTAAILHFLRRPKCSANSGLLGRRFPKQVRKRLW